MFNPTRSLSLSLSLFLYSSFSSRQQICEEGTQHRRVIGRLAIAYNSGSVNVSSIQSVSGIKVLSVLQGLPIIHRVALSKAIDRIFRRQRVVYICVYIYNVCVCVYMRDDREGSICTIFEPTRASKWKCRSADRSLLPRRLNSFRR
jgi:hypothetical protein